MRKILLILSAIIISFQSDAQQFVFDLMSRTDLKYQEIEQIAKRHFDSVGTGRGTGYKQFQRWLYERKFHTDENGNYIFPQQEWSRYAQSRAGLLANRTEAASWTELGPKGWTWTSGWNPGTGRLSTMAIQPSNESIIYVGSPGGGLWKSTDAGSSWVPLTDHNGLWMYIFAVTIDPVDPNIIYAGTGNNANVVLKSTNGGSSFTATGSGPAGTIRKILVHPTSTNIVFACASNGIFRSTNGGDSWTQVHTGSKEDIEFKVDDVNIMLATGNDVWRSVNNGVTWTPIGSSAGITNTGRTLVSVTPADPNIVYVCQASGNLFGRLYKSVDAGLTFTTTVVGSTVDGTNYFGYLTDGTDNTGQANHDMALEVSPTNANVIHIAGVICWRSTNGGIAFTATTEWSYPNNRGYNHADVHGLFYVNNNLYSLSDGGIYKSTDHADNWVDLSPGLGIRQFYRIASSQTNPMVITGGAQDNGSATRQGAGNWVDWLGADGMEGLVSPTNHLKIWGTSQNGTLYRSTNGGNTYTNLGRPSAGEWVTPLASHPTDDNIIYGGWTGVYKSVNSGTTWTNISVGSTSGAMDDLAVAPSNPNYIYASNGATLYVTTDDGLTWNTRVAPAVINDIAVSPTDPNKIWIACNSTTNRILVSTNGGLNFTNISANLPNIIARTIALDDKVPQGIYVGMNLGVYFKEEDAATWTDFSDNLPLVAINELEVQHTSGLLRVATYGRGVWETPVQTIVPPAGFSFSTPAAATAACPAPATMAISLGTTSVGGFTNSISLSATGAPSGTSVSFAPNNITPGNSTTVTLTGTNTLLAGSYNITVTGTATGATTQTRVLTFTINAGTGPAITLQPTDKTVCAAANTTFTVTSPSASTIQWQVSTDGGNVYTNISNGGIYSGATTGTLTLTSVTSGLTNNRYRAVTSTICGSTNSNAGLLIVNSAPTVSAQPQNTTLCAGGNHSFSVTATGGGLGYQWYLSTNGGSSYDPILNGGIYSNATTATLNITGITAAMSGYLYRVEVTGTCTPVAISNAASLTVVTSVNITSQPANAVVCNGSNASFLVAGSGTGIIYQWQISTDGGVNYSNIPGETGASINLTSVTPAMNGFMYRAQLSNSTCTTPGISSGATLTVNALTNIATISPNPVLCVGSNQTITVAATGTSLTYQWQISTDGGGSFANIPGAAANSYQVNGVTISMHNYRYRVVVTGTCGTVTSAGIIFTVIEPAGILTQPSNVTVCTGTDAVFNVAGTGTSLVYQWQVSTNGGVSYTNIAGANASSYTVASASLSNSNNLYRALVSNTTCTTPLPSGAATLLVRQLPTVTLTAAPLTSLLPGQSTILTATPSGSTGGTLTTTWFKNLAPFAHTGNTLNLNVETIGRYQVKIQESFPDGTVCANESAIIDITATANSKLFIFPSPNDGQFTVSYYNSNGSTTSRTITVYDSKGSKVYHGQFQVSGPYTLLDINIKPAQGGIYYVVVGDAAGKKMAEGKIVVQ